MKLLYRMSLTKHWSWLQMVRRGDLLTDHLMDLVETRRLVYLQIAFLLHNISALAIFVTGVSYC